MTATDERLIFPCPYCQARVDVSATLSECIVSCPACARSVLAPALNMWSEPVIIKKGTPLTRSRAMRIFLVVVGVMAGAAVGSLVLLIPMWYYALSIIGLGVRHVTAAGLLGGALGAFFGGLLFYRATQD